MRQFYWKIALCLLPVLIAVGFIYYAWQHDRFKLGVDLSGGTILVYEIDTRKQKTDDKSRTTPREQANLLAESLKRRIDPNDLKNIVIRTAGEGRVEIILPTGGVERAKKAEREWDALLAKMRAKYTIDKLDVPRGQDRVLAERIQQIVGERIWTAKLFPPGPALTKLENRVLPTRLKSGAQAADEEEDFLRPLAEENTRQKKLAVTIAGSIATGPSQVAPLAYNLARDKETLFSFQSLQPFKAKGLPEFIADVKKRVNDYAKEKEIEAWFKDQAWKQLIADLIQKYPQLKERKALFSNIQPDSFEELVGRVVVKGDSIAQAFVSTLEPILGQDIISASAGDGKAGFIDRREVAQFVEDHYGPSLQSIEKAIEADNQQSGRTRDVSVEAIQDVKDKVAKVGSLEFRILANSHDDKDAIKDATDLITNNANKGRLDEWQAKGLPPVGPTTDGSWTGTPKEYELTTLHRDKSTVTYSWVELGPQERQQLGLNNAAKNEPGRGKSWHEMDRNRNKAIQLPVPFDATERKHLLQGALFFSRRCTDRNLPEEERRKKQFEYFILTRNPEIDLATAKETPKIDGTYLTSAVSQLTEGRPAVSFTFDGTGGDLFGKLTRKNIPSGTANEMKRHLAIILDGLVVSAPTINSEIRQHGQISGSFTPREVDQLVNILRSGALPATLKQQPVSEGTVPATLGAETIQKGVFAVEIAFVVIILFMIVYYRFAGVVASVALMANLILTIGFMVAVQATFTLPGLAGLVLMLGMAVDANVLIYERLREERERGASLTLALRNGYDRAFPTIIDTHLSSIFTAIVLYAVGNDQLKGFGVSLTAGLIISLFTSLYMTRLMFDLWQHMGWLKKLSMLRLFAKPDIDFMRVRYYWFAGSAITSVLGLALFIGRLPNDLDIDFVGGTAYTGEPASGKTLSVETLHELLSDKNQKERLQLADGKPRAEVRELEHKDNRYAVKFKMEDGSTTPERTVALANEPDGSSPEERARTVAVRLRNLPDASAQLLLTGGLGTTNDKEQDKAKAGALFTVRTSEKEPELVQAMLERLLQEKTKDGQWESLLKKVVMKANPLSQNGRETRLFFSEEKTKDAAVASPSFVRTLLMRELLREFGEKNPRQLKFQVELVGEGKPKDDRYHEMKVTFSPTSEKSMEGYASQIKTALKRTEDEFKYQPQPVMLYTFDSQLAADTRLRAMYAILLSWGAILVYLWFRFGNWTFGMAAVLCLIHDLCFTLGLIAVCHYLHGTAFGNFLGLEDFKIDLTAVAALLTLVGYSVNDTIVVFDRIREVRGKNPDLTPQMINDSVNQTLSRTVLASLTAWLVVVVLYIWGGSGVHLFAYVMVVGVVVGTYSSIYIASPLLLIFGEGAKATAKSRDRAPAPTAPKPEVRIQPAQ